MGLGHNRPQIFLPTLLPLCVAHLMARSAHIPPYLARGELWVVKFRDGTMKRMLLRLVEWDALAPSVPRPTSGTSGPTCEDPHARLGGAGRLGGPTPLLRTVIGPRRSPKILLPLV